MCQSLLKPDFQNWKSGYTNKLSVFWNIDRKMGNTVFMLLVVMLHKGDDYILTSGITILRIVNTSAKTIRHRCPQWMGVCIIIYNCRSVHRKRKGCPARTFTIRLFYAYILNLWVYLHWWTFLWFKCTWRVPVDHSCSHWLGLKIGLILWFCTSKKSLTNNMHSEFLYQIDEFCSFPLYISIFKELQKKEN